MKYSKERRYAIGVLFFFLTSWVERDWGKVWIAHSLLLCVFHYGRPKSIFQAILYATPPVWVTRQQPTHWQCAAVSSASVWNTGSSTISKNQGSKVSVSGKQNSLRGRAVFYFNMCTTSGSWFMKPGQCWCHHVLCPRGLLIINIVIFISNMVWRKSGIEISLQLTFT